MRVFRSPASQAHDPPLFFRRGKTIPHPERHERVTVLETALGNAGFALADPDDRGRGVIEAIHDPDYVRFLESAWSRRAELDPNATEILTTGFSKPQMNHKPTGLVGLLGYYMSDTSTSIVEGTWQAIYGAAQAAAAAADEALAIGSAYALCRPPGHHAFADCAGGFCYFNNTAIAAQRLRMRGAERVAILDIDVHHGNGTQGIFYPRADVLTVSIHGDPANYFPFYAGYAEETGAGEGAGFNLNMPLVHGSGDATVLSAVDAALERIAAYKPSALVIALGLDASEHDPIGVLKVTTEGFAAIAARIARQPWPVTLIQEGGYLCDALPRNLIAFLTSFDRERLR
ncbi:MAG TPA: histone deacetylase family protein [Magnetospirillaceae bacterium]|jgi:acetoin utilization deacetylase AcuC-like enzyme